MLLVICEGGLLESQALARSGSCSRSLYAVCEKLLGPAVKNKRGRLFLEIMTAREAQLLEDERVDLDRLRSYWEDERGRVFGEITRAREAQLLEDERVHLDRLRRNWEDLQRQVWVIRRLMFGHGFCEFQVTEAIFAKNEWRHSLRECGGVGPRELQTYSPETLRQWRQLTARDLCFRHFFTNGYTRPWRTRQW